MPPVDVFGDDLDLDSRELQALLVSLFGGHTLVPSSGNNTVVFMEGLLEVTFKSGENRILGVGPSSGRQGWPAQRLLDAIDTALIRDQVPDAVAHRVLFARSSDLDAFSKQIRFGRERNFCLISEPEVAPNVVTVGQPCHVTIGYPHTGHNYLDRHRQAIAFIRARDLLAGLAQASTPYQFFDPYGSRVRNEWFWTHHVGDSMEHHESRVAQLGYTWERALGPDDIDEIKGTTDHSDLHDDLDRVEQLDTGNAATFLTACSWAHQALITESGTLRLLCLTTLIETLLDDDSQRCEKCGQPVYSVSRRFEDRITSVLGPDAARWAKELYGLRSSASHRGAWLAGEGLTDVPMIVPKHSHERWSTMWLGQRASHILRAWLSERRPV